MCVLSMYVCTMYSRTPLVRTSMYVLLNTKHSSFCSLIYTYVQAVHKSVPNSRYVTLIRSTDLIFPSRYVLTKQVYCTYVSIPVHTVHTYLGICIFRYMYVCMYNTYVHTYFISMENHTVSHMYIHTYVCPYICMYACT